MVNLTIIRGLPGSGKSTLAKKMATLNSSTHLEADMFMVNDEGEYDFDSNRLPEVHKKCLDQALKALLEGKSVIVSNTFVKIWEMQPYLDLPYPTTIITTTGTYKNTHQVPKVTLQTMAANWETYNP